MFHLKYACIFRRVLLRWPNASWKSSTEPLSRRIQTAPGADGPPMAEGGIHGNELQRHLRRTEKTLDGRASRGEIELNLEALVPKPSPGVIV